MKAVGARIKPGQIIRKASDMKDYFIRVFADCADAEPGYKDYKVRTAFGPNTAKMLAFLMDGGCGTEYHDDAGVMALAQSYCDIVSVP